MKNYCWLLFILYAIPSKTTAQGVIRGLVMESDSTVVPMAVVKLLGADSATLVHHTRSRLSGEWVIVGVQPGHYVLHVSSLGLEPWVERVTIKDSDSLFFTVVLQEVPITLRVVEISASKIGIIEHGDTLIYDLSLYRDSSDTNLKDILNRLPDISVGEGGIMYKGKRVNLALVEGRDIFGSLHKAMTESIAAGDIKGIQIIRNYKDATEQEARAQSDKIALNVQLTDVAREKLNGDIRLGAGLMKFAEGGLVAYRTKDKWGYSLILKANNTGEPVISALDFLGLELDEVMEEPKKFSSASSEELIRSMLRIRPDIQQQMDGLAAINMEGDWHLSWKSKANIRLITTNKTGESVVLRQFLQKNAILLGRQFRRDNYTPLQINISNNYRGNRKWLKQKLFIGTHEASDNVTLNGELSGLYIENQFLHRTGTIDIKTMTEGGLRIDSTRTLSTKIGYEYNRLREVTNLSSSDIVPGTSEASLLQFHVPEKATLSANISLQQTKGAQQITSSIGYFQTSYRLASSTEPQPPAGVWSLHTHVRDINNYCSAEWSLRSDTLRYRAQVRIDYMQRTFVENFLVHRYILPSLQLGVYRDFSILHHLYFTLNYEKTPAPFQNLWRYNRIRSENTFFDERVDSFFTQNKVSANISYARTERGKYLLMIRQELAWKGNEVLYQAVPIESWLIYRSFLSPSTLQINTNLMGNWRIRPLRLTPSFNLSHTYNRGLTALGNDILNFESSEIFCKTTFNLEIKQALNIRLHYNPNHTNQSFGGGSPLRLTSHRLGGGLSYSNSRFKANLSVSYNAQSLSQVSNRYWLLNFDAEYKFSKPRIRVYIIGENALNLQGNILLLPDFSPTYYGFSRFQTIGGRIMLGAAYLL